MAIMGVTMVNKNGYPLGADPGSDQSPIAKLAHDALSVSTNANVLAVAGYMLSVSGAILRGSGKLRVRYGSPGGERAATCAQPGTTGDPGVANLLEQHREIQRQIQAARR